MFSFVLSLCVLGISLFAFVIGVNCFFLPLYITVGTKLWGKLFKWNLYYGEVISINNINMNGKMKPVYTVKYNVNGVDYSIQLNKVGSMKQIGDKVKLIHLLKSNKIKSGELGYLNLILGIPLSFIGLMSLIGSSIWFFVAISNMA